MKQEKTDKRKELNDAIIKKMEKSIQYSTPWLDYMGRPFNPETGTIYRGINFVSLSIRGYSDPRFFTFDGVKRFAKKNGLNMHIKKGEKGCSIFKSVKFYINDDRKEHENVIEVKNNDNTSDHDHVLKGKKFFFQNVYCGVVFNASQIEGIPPYEDCFNNKLTPIEEADLIALAMKRDGLEICYGGNYAAYSHEKDKVFMPHMNKFISSEAFYSTQNHEIGHATGHKNRLNRFKDKKTLAVLDSDEKIKDYAFEELVAELSSYYIGSDINIPYDRKTHENNAAYLKHWIKLLRNDGNVLFKASAQASKATDYVIDLKKKLKLELYPELAKIEIKNETLQDCVKELELQCEVNNEMNM